MKSGVIVFPGSNCDHDCYHILKHVLGCETHWIWHKETQSLKDFDLIVLPGGFSYGDYLRAGAIARFSPVMKEVVRFADSGGRVLGICNGFQVLVESGLLPGALLRNQSQKFICKSIFVKVENPETPFTNQCGTDSILNIPIAHHEGSYYADAETIGRMSENGQILFRYCDADGAASEASNPNGSVENIAGVASEAKNVLGLMPHPERSADPALFGIDGQLIFKSLMSAA